MSSYVRTVHTTMNPADTVSAAETIAEALRAEGKTVTVGPVHDDVTLRWYGMPAVDMTVWEDDAPLAPPETPVAPDDDAPEPMPVAEFAGSPQEEAAIATTQPPPGERFTGSSPTETVASVAPDVDTELDTASADIVDEAVNTADTEDPEGTSIETSLQPKKGKGRRAR